MIEYLEEHLAELYPNDISRFSLAGAETLWLSLQRTYEKEFKGNINITSELFDKAWLLVDGQLNDTTSDQLEAAARSQIPDLDNFMDVFESAWRSALASAAQNAATGVWLSVRGLGLNPLDAAIDTADIIASTLDLLISTQYSTTHSNDMFPPEEYIVEHALYQQEIKRQRSAIDALKNGRTADFRPAFVARLNLETLGLPPL